MMNAVHNAGYTSEPYPYLTNGDTTDWTYGIFRMPSITIELRPTGTTGTGGFELPASDIIPTCEENLPAALYLIAWNEADLNNDHIVNLQDMAILSSNWLASGCDQSNICCQEADIFGSGTVDEDDLAILADQWGAQSIFDDTIPDPDPMSFSSPPAATSDSSISMTATEATDNNGVQYYFACTAGAGHDSGWQPGRTYEDTGLLPSREYTYTVIARDTSASHNQTAASDPAAATTNPPDTTKPDPDPMSFSSLPAATGERSIEMTAALATDSSGVQYYFTCTAGAGHNSQWQDSRTYEDTSLTHSTTYAYKVKARDKSAAHNETALSDPAAATTNVEVILIENIVLPANGGDLESFTSEYGSGFLASDLTNGNTDEDGWACATNPSVDQEFVFSFRDGKNATLSNAVIHGGTAEGSYYSENVEVWTSADGSTFTLAGSDTLLEQDNDSVTITLTGIEAKKIKLVVTSGYDSQWWELAEFVVNGDVID
jgi:hypothetical protein